jgi:hypothetical protein
MERNPETYKIVRQQIEHIDNSLSQRVIWMVIAQSFFFSAFAILVTGKPLAPEIQSVYTVLLKVIPIAALLTVAFTFIDVIASVAYMKNLRKSYESAPKNDEPNKLFPAIHGSKKERVFMHASPFLIPVIFIIIWGTLMTTQYKNPAPTFPPEQQQQPSQIPSGKA